MQKHAYMIIAHNDFDLLETLVRLLDDPRNDLYIHIDAKVQDFDFARFHAARQFTVYTPAIVCDLGSFFPGDDGTAFAANSSGRGESGASVRLLPFDLRRGSAY